MHDITRREMRDYMIKLSYARREVPRIFSCEAENIAKQIKLSYARREAPRIFSCEAENIAKLYNLRCTGELFHNYVCGTILCTEV